MEPPSSPSKGVEKRGRKGTQQALVFVSLLFVVAIIFWFQEEKELGFISLSRLQSDGASGKAMRKPPIWLRVAERDKLAGRKVDHSNVAKPGHRRILVTGAAGFIGSQTSIRFQQRGDIVVGLVREAYELITPHFFNLLSCAHSSGQHE